MVNQLFRLVSFKKIVFLLLVALGLFVRFYKLGQIPPGLSWDEASIGYNAWILEKTGRDEWGEFLPLHFRAFGEWKLPAYIYGTIPFVKLFGLNHLSVRLLSALSGVVFVLSFAWLWRIWVGRTAAVIAFFLSLFSFWSVFFSRVAFEANLALAFFTLGMALFFFRKSFLATLFFLATVYTYNSFRLLAFPFFVFLLFLEKHRFSRRRIVFLIVIFVGGLMPVLYFFLKEPTAFSRFNQVAVNWNSFERILLGYISHFSPSFLLLFGDPNWRHSSGWGGQFSLLEVLSFALGVYFLFFREEKKRFSLRKKALFLFWLLISPLPAALTKETPHALRSILLLPAILNFSVFGIYVFIRRIKLNSLLWRVMFSLVFIGLIFQYGLFYRDYFLDYSNRAAIVFQEEYEPLFAEIARLDKTKKVFITTQRGQPYIFYLFYFKRNLFQTSFTISPVSFWHKSRVSRIDNVYFLDEKDLIRKLMKKEEGYYVFTWAEVSILSPEADIIYQGGKDGFYIFKI